MGSRNKDPHPARSRGGEHKMNVIIVMDASAKEIAALVLAVQGRQSEGTREATENKSSSEDFYKSTGITQTFS